VGLRSQIAGLRSQVSGMIEVSDTINDSFGNSLTTDVPFDFKGRQNDKKLLPQLSLQRLQSIPQIQHAEPF